MPGHAVFFATNEDCACVHACVRVTEAEQQPLAREPVSTLKKPPVFQPVCLHLLLTLVEQLLHRHTSYSNLMALALFSLPLEPIFIRQRACQRWQQLPACIGLCGLPQAYQLGNHTLYVICTRHTASHTCKWRRSTYGRLFRLPLLDTHGPCETSVSIRRRQRTRFADLRSRSPK